MKLYEITLKPLSAFGTTLKGDTLFGHFCWQAAYDEDILKGGLEANLASYFEKPFAVFSSALVKLDNGYVLKRPDMPLAKLFSINASDRIEKMKQIKEKKGWKWMLVKSIKGIDLSSTEFMNNEMLIKKITGENEKPWKKSRGKHEARLIMPFSQAHNTINRLTQCTGTNQFAPYTQENYYFYPDTLMAVLILIDEDVTDIDHVEKAVKRIGQWGFGRDASIGQGRFEIKDVQEIPVPDHSDSDACYTLGPCVPEKQGFSESYFTPFTRFGKHGGECAVKHNPFKNPVVMADEGAVFLPLNKSAFEKPYIGRAVSNVSKQQKNAVHQGYSLYLPLKLTQGA